MTTGRRKHLLDIRASQSKGQIVEAQGMMCYTVLPLAVEAQRGGRRYSAAQGRQHQYRASTIRE